jgi:hypothetical protein
VTTTAAQWVETVKDYVLSGYREEQDILAAAITTTTATTLSTTDATPGIQQGAEIEIDLERMYVRSVSGTTVTVRRGYRGTTPATHVIDSDIIVMPKAPKASILRELNNELASLSSPENGIYKIATVDLTWSGSRIGYDLTSVPDVESILEVRYQDYGSFKDWPIVNPSQYELARNMPTTEFASGMGLLFNDGVAPGQTVRVRYSVPFTPLSALTDVVETVTGIPSTAVDIPPMGAAINLTGPSEIRRTFEGQSDPRQDDDVPTGAKIGSVRWLMAKRQQRIAEEASRLGRDFPVHLARS